jgi:hypothetical protein
MSPPRQTRAVTTAVVDEPTSSVVLTVALGAGAAEMYVTRQPVGSTTISEVRGYAAASPAEVTPSTTVFVRDYEAPIGRPLVYTVFTRATPTSAWVPQTPTSPVTLTSSRDWLVDLSRPTNSRPVLVESFAELDHEIPQAVLRILSRRDPVVVSDVAWTYAAQLVLLTLEPGDEERIRDTIGNGIPVLFKTPPEHGVGNAYLSIVDWKVQRVSRLASRPERRFLIDVVQVARPDPAVFRPIPPMTYARVQLEWATYAALAADPEVPSYADLLYHDPGSVEPTPTFPWLPVDA